jgi:hypothetical protein
MHELLGVKAERVPLSGAVRYQENGTDVDVYLFGPDAAPWCGEVKSRAGEKSGFVLIERWLADADFLALWRDRANPLIVLPWARWCDILQQLKSKGTSNVLVSIPTATESVDDHRPEGPDDPSPSA